MNSWMKFSGAVTIGLALTLGTAARAQPTDGPPPPQPDQRDGQGDDRRGSADKKDRQDRREGRRGGLVRQIGQIARELNLDESQRRAIRDIFEQSREDAQRIHEEIQDAGARQAELQKLAEKVRTGLITFKGGEAP
ncbi:MAG TPA: hypothetical protein PK402_04435, partial [Tepidisphaeraceae bacterium]|nr:hypothetical protein [Tepidisphaeraceae bacterium]